MAYILHIETATEVCSVSVAKDGQILYSKEETKGPSHASVLGVFVEDALKYIRANGLQLDAVAVSSGPGSYTGLRIGVSEAKGLCYGLSIPLIAIESLKIMAAGFMKLNTIAAADLLCPMIDARRMEVYDAVFDGQLDVKRQISADIIDENSFQEFLGSAKVYFFGNGSAKCKEVLHHTNAVFVDGVYPQSVNMAELAEDAFRKKEFVDVAYFEPFYLKEFVATTPKNKILPQ